MQKDKNINYYEFYIGSIFCASCELNIEDKLKKLKSVDRVVVDYKTGLIKIWGNLGSNKQAFYKVDKAVRELGYFLKHDKDTPRLIKINFQKSELFIGLILSILILLSFYGLTNLKIISFNFDLNNFISYFVLGIFASFSSCAAIVGTVLISLISRDMKLGVSRSQMFLNQIVFHISRFVGFTFLGGVLGVIGQTIDNVYILSFIITIFILSATINRIKIKNLLIYLILYFSLFSLFFLVFTNFIKVMSLYFDISLNILSQAAFTILIAIYLFLLSLSILGISNINLNFRLPKIIEHEFLKKKDIAGIIPSILLGVFSFFLPCGFTFTAQNGALLSGSFVMGAIFMFMFSLGTFPLLALISFTSLSVRKENSMKKIFLVTSAFLMCFISFYNILNAFRLIGVVF